MMVLDLQSFDTVEVVGFNELFKLVPNPFPNSNSFRNPDSFENLGFFENPDKFENFEIFVPISKKFRVPDPTRYFGFTPLAIEL